MGNVLLKVCASLECTINGEKLKGEGPFKKFLTM